MDTSARLPHPAYPSTAQRELPEPAPRQLSHQRTVIMNGYRRDDGLLDIEGELQDLKPQAWSSWECGMLPPEQAVHHLRVRMTIDRSLNVQAVVAALPATPFRECQATLPPLAQLAGSNLARSWRKAVEAALGQAAGCTHIRELLMAMATVAFQTLAGEQRRAAMAALPPGQTSLPPPTEVLPHWGQCIGWALDGAVVQRVAPGVVRPPGPAAR